MSMTGVITFSFFMVDRLGVGRWIGNWVCTCLRGCGPAARACCSAGRWRSRQACCLALAMFLRHKPWFEISSLPAQLAERTLWSLHLAVGAGLTLLAVLSFIGLMLDVPRLARTR